MIIKFPTGFYSDILPMALDQPGNITFTVSDQKPPRADLSFPQIPTGLYYKRRSQIAADTYLQNPIFYVSTSNTAVLNNNTQQFEIGQIIEPSLSPVNVVITPVSTAKYDSVHNLNQFDYNAMGLTGVESSVINENSKIIYKQLNEKLNDLKAEIEASDININRYQKTLNETEKTIKAVTIMIANTSDTSVKDQLIITLNQLERTKTLTEEAIAIQLAKREDTVVNIKVTLDELNNLSVVVK